MLIGREPEVENAVKIVDDLIATVEPPVMKIGCIGIAVQQQSGVLNSPPEPTLC